MVTQLALAYPEVGFTLTSAGRTVLQCPPAVSHRDRLYQVYGERSDLMEVHKEAGGITLTGFIAALAEQGPTRGPQNVFINRRIVKDRTIAHAIIDSYSQASIKERSPEVHLFIEMPPDALDVNVHPTKAEVRFRDQSLVHEVVRRALMDALGQSAAPQLQLRPEHMAQTPFTATLPDVLCGRRLSEPLDARHDRKEPQSAQGPQSASGVRKTRRISASSASVRGCSFVVVADPDIKPMIPLGQFRDTFIIAVDDEGIAIIDQHVAHERVLFERVMERLTSGRLESQRLLVPMVIDLTPSAQQALVNRDGRARASRLRGRAVRRRHHQGDGGAGAAEDRGQLEGAAGAGRGSRGARSRRAGAGRAAADRGDDGVSCGGEGQLSADLREDGAHPRRAAGDRVFDHLSRTDVR